MPRFYRSMQEENGKPKIGRSVNALGVRVDGHYADIDLEDDGTVKQNGKGMSVAPAPEYLPPHRVYEGLAHIVEGASATDRRLRIWRMGTGPFLALPINTELALLPDPPRAGKVIHGVVGPRQVVRLEAYEAALTSTQAEWSLDESGAENE